MRALALVIVAVGCAHQQEARHDPRHALRSWSEAVAHNDPHAAYALHSPRVKARLSEPDSAREWRPAPGELSQQQDELRTAAPTRHAAVRLRDGRSLAVLREDEAWRVASPHPLDEGASTPDEALEALLQAVDARDFDALLLLLADPLRSTLEDALADRLEKLRTAVKKGGLEVSGEHTRIRYGTRYHIDLIQENGRWRVADFN